MSHSFLRTPFKIGSLELSSNIFCAPLAGCSDLAFRRMTSAYKPGLIFCEMVKMDALVRHDPSTFRLLDYEGGMHPIGAQLCGSKPQYAGPAARMMEELGFDLVDLNCGCPVDKVTKDGSGSGLLKNPELIGEIISEMCAAVKIPVTLKIRAGWDDKQINALLVAQIAEKAGAKAICIHGRTREQGYKGFANWDHIRDCKAATNKILVIGNGDIVDVASAERIFAHTHCDAILLARGSMGQPWLIEDIHRHFMGMAPLIRSGNEYREALLEHLEHVLSYLPERKAVFAMRRISCYYLKKGVGAKKLREKLSRVQSIAEVREYIHSYPWEEIDFSSGAAEPIDEECEVEC